MHGKRKLSSPRVKRKPRGSPRTFEGKMEIAKEMFRGKPIKAAAFDHDLSEEAIRHIFKTFISWKMVWIGPPFQEEFDI